MNTILLLVGLLLPSGDPPVATPSDNAPREEEIQKLKEKLRKAEETIRRQREQMDEYLRDRAEAQRKEAGAQKREEERLKQALNVFDQLLKGPKPKGEMDDRVPLPPGVCAKQLPGRCRDS
ncbi:MAG TPA: hypothetical protein VK395_00405 [Gemmataceae bacterium]|nr:hypothetical protein [Gemmataceae bacterium]